MQNEKSEANNRQISNSKVEDNGAKLIFDNPTLCAQLLRGYSDIDLLKNVQAEDITDVTECYIPMFTEERNADVVKRVRINDNDDVFITLIEHKSRVDYNVAMQILRYMVYIWEDYEKQQERRIPGVSKLAGFKYPPVFPIVYYNGEGNWTVDESFISRIALSNIFSPYVPDFRYQLVNIADHGNDELVQKNDGLSFLMIINKIKNSEEFSSIDLPREYLDNLSANTPEDVLDVLSRVVAVLLRKQHVPEDEVQIFVNQIKERQMSDLFEGFKGINVMEERKIGQNKGEETKLIKMVCKKLSLGQSVEQIALDLIEDEAIVGEISSVAAKYAPDYDVEAIYMDLKIAEKKTL